MGQKRQTSESSDSGFARRDFIKGGAVLAAGALAAEMLAGCAPSSGTKETDTAKSSGAKYEVYDTDVLILGGGYVGRNAALEAYDRGANVTVVEKSEWGRGGAAGMNWGVIVQDIPKGEGKTATKLDLFTQGGLINQNVAYEVNQVSAEEGMIARTVNLGTTTLQRKEDGSVVTLPLNCGVGIKNVFPRHESDVAVATGISIFERTMITDLIVDKGVCIGAIGLYLPTGTMRVFRAKATIAAAGGFAWYMGWVTCGVKGANSPDCTGDLDAVALRHGCRVYNLELNVSDLILSYPTGIAYSYTGGLGCDPLYKDVICDKDGDYWMRDRKQVARIEFMNESVMKVREGKGGPNGGVFVDLRDVDGQPSPLLAKFGDYQVRNIKPMKEKFGIDVRKERLEVSPNFGETCGHPLIDASFQTDVEGLFWPNSQKLYWQTTNSYFGAVVGARKAVAYSKNVKAPKADAIWAAADTEYERLHKLLDVTPKDALRPHVVRHTIQNLAYETLGPIKNQEGLQKCIDECARIRKEDIPRMAPSIKTMTYNVEWKEAIENYNLLDMTEAQAHAAIMRTESRAVFVREDYPKQDDDNWLCGVAVSYKDGKMETEKLDLDCSLFTHDEVKAIISSKWGA